MVCHRTITDRSGRIPQFFLDGKVAQLQSLQHGEEVGLLDGVPQIHYGQFGSGSLSFWMARWHNCNLALGTGRWMGCPWCATEPLRTVCARIPHIWNVGVATHLHIIAHRVSCGNKCGSSNTIQCAIPHGGCADAIDISKGREAGKQVPGRVVPGPRNT